MNLLPFQLPLLHSRSYLPNRLLPRQVASRLRARVVERWLCLGDHRVVQRCTVHPPWVGGLSSPQHFLCEEMLGAPSAPYIHVGGPHDFAHSANSWGTLAAAGNCKQGGWEAPGCGKGCPHIQTVLARAGVCTYETRVPARGPRLFERSENMWGGLWPQKRAPPGLFRYKKGSFKRDTFCV